GLENGDIGLIESITMKNFMCHNLLGPFHFGSNVNFIVGNNGSGKSAILTALIVGLGGKATVTNRGASLKDFVRTGENTADVTVKLRNRGPDAFKGDVYGDCISIEHRITSDGCRTCRLKSKSAVHLYLVFQLDNPVSILNQEMSKQFLHSKSESDKYKFFMKATLLEQMKRDYIHIKQTKTVTRDQVERQEECLKDLKQEFLQKKERYENMSSFSEMKATLENLKKKMAWCLVRVNLLHLHCPCTPLKLYIQVAFISTRLEEKNIQVSFEAKQKRRNQLLASRSNKLKRFGDRVPELLASIDEAYAMGRFLKKPIGPIGAYISLKDPTLAVAVECCLRSFMKTFCCDNYKDETVLQELMSRYYHKGSRPQIIVSPFTEKVYNIHGRKVHHPVYPSVFDIISTASPVIINCLIDMRGIESILIIKEKHTARRIMQRGPPPKGCREAFTLEGDQVYSNRYYTSDFSMLLGDALVPFHYSPLLKTTFIMDYARVCLKFLNLRILQEEVFKENQQKIEMERQAVNEAKIELDKHRKTAEDIDSSYSCVREKIDQLSEEMEPLKVTMNWLILISEMLTTVYTLLQESVAKASEISPERQQVDRSAKSIDTEITRLKKRISVQESTHGDQEEYAEALAVYRDKSNQVRDLKRFIDRLDNIMSDRQNRYKILRRSLSVRCKLYFNNFLIKLNCCGSMIFDHNNETLSISVKPPGRENDDVSDMKSLSGGERSFSTVCFILSLWEITESPFRCLDEFDVYMDMHYRRISLDLLLELSERQHLRQFIFITPLTTR
uniref:Structural maintenance of chromosomes 6 n=1 Tax=Myripristis murdjan TaxID=586833 RepID=A0A668AAD1_9TELE